jgi:hypothetical protein
MAHSTVVNDKIKEENKRRFKELDRRSRDIEREKNKILRHEGYKEGSGWFKWLIFLVIIIGAAVYFLFLRK